MAQQWTTRGNAAPADNTTSSPTSPETANAETHKPNVLHHVPMNRGTIAATAALLALSACGQSEPETTATVTVTPTPTASATAASPTPTPSPTEWSMEEAGKKYQAMVKAVNAPNATLSKVSTKEDRTVNEMAAQCRKVADATYDFIADLRKGHWPKEVQTDIDTLIDASKVDAAGNEKCAAAMSIPAIEAGFIMSQESGSSGASAVVRAGLGLPRP